MPRPRQGVEREIDNIMAAIKAGILTESTKSPLEGAEAERLTLRQTLAAPSKTVAKGAVFLLNASAHFKSLLQNLEAATQSPGR